MSQQISVSPGCFSFQLVTEGGKKKGSKETNLPSYLCVRKVVDLLALLGPALCSVGQRFLPGLVFQVQIYELEEHKIETWRGEE